MVRSYSVNSLYKNPDKFIEKLKRNLTDKDDQISYWMSQCEELTNENRKLTDDAFGKHWFNYKEDVTHSVSFCKNPLAKSKLGSVGDQVVIVGEIIQITQLPKKNVASAVFHTHTVYLKKNVN